MAGGIGPDDFHAVAEDLLTVAVYALDQIPTLVPGEGLDGAPARAFVDISEPVWDCCPMLVVYTDGITQSFTRPTSPGDAVGARHRRGSWMWEVRLVLAVGRCVPEGTVSVVGGKQKYNPPDPVLLTAAARQISADGWALANTIANALEQGVLHDKCSGWKWDGVNPASHMGGCAGWVINFRAQLDGYGYGVPVTT